MCKISDEHYIRSFQREEHQAPRRERKKVVYSTHRFSFWKSASTVSSAFFLCCCFFFFRFFCYFFFAVRFTSCMSFVRCFVRTDMYTKILPRKAIGKRVQVCSVSVCTPNTASQFSCLKNLLVARMRALPECTDFQYSFFSLSSFRFFFSLCFMLCSFEYLFAWNGEHWIHFCICMINHPQPHENR